MLIAFEGADIIEVLTTHAKDDYENVEEILCDIGASEFLISSEEIEHGFQNLDIQCLKKLLQKYSQASSAAIARKLATLYSGRAIFIICCKKEDECVIEYAFSSKKMLPYRVKRFLRIPNDHLFRFDYEEYAGSEDRGETTFPFKKPWKCYGEYFVENGRLYGILHEKRPVDKSAQGTLF